MFKWLRPEDLIWLTGAGTLVFTTLIQKMSSKYKPWTRLGQQIGRAVNKEMIEKLDKLEQKVDKLEETDIKQNEERDREKALEARRRILRFADECRRHEKHSEEYFDNILEDINMYRDYCHEHPTFENEKVVIATAVIGEIYRHCIEDDDFL